MMEAAGTLLTLRIRGAGGNHDATAHAPDRSRELAVGLRDDGGKIGGQVVGKRLARR